MNDQNDPLGLAMRSYAARLASTHSAPPVSLVWFRAERRRHQLAVERAERPLRVMQMLSVIGAALAAAWMLWRALQVDPPGMPGTGLLLIVCAGIVLIAGGCWMMLAASRRPSS
jgi:hypothetical protein